MSNIDERKELADIIKRRREADERISTLEDALYNSLEESEGLITRRNALAEDMARIECESTASAIDSILSGNAVDSASADEIGRIQAEILALDRSAIMAEGLQAGLRARVTSERDTLATTLNVDYAIGKMVSSSEEVLTLCRETRAAWLKAYHGSIQIKYLIDRGFLNVSEINPKLNSDEAPMKSLEALAFMSFNSEHKRIFPENLILSMPDSWGKAVKSLQHDPSTALPGSAAKAKNPKTLGLF